MFNPLHLSVTILKHSLKFICSQVKKYKVEIMWALLVEHISSVATAKRWTVGYFGKTWKAELPLGCHTSSWGPFDFLCLPRQLWKTSRETEPLHALRLLGLYKWSSIGTSCRAAIQDRKQWHFRDLLKRIPQIEPECKTDFLFSPKDYNHAMHIIQSDSQAKDVWSQRLLVVNTVKFWRQTQYKSHWNRQMINWIFVWCTFQMATFILKKRFGVLQQIC